MFIQLPLLKKDLHVNAQDSTFMGNVSTVWPWRNSSMYKVYHEFVDTGEWGCTEVDTLCEALSWFNVKLASRTQLKNAVVLYDRDNTVLKRVCRNG